MAGFLICFFGKSLLRYKIMLVQQLVTCRLGMVLKQQWTTKQLATLSGIPSCEQTKFLGLPAGEGISMTSGEGTSTDSTTTPQTRPCSLGVGDSELTSLRRDETSLFQ